MELLFRGTFEAENIEQIHVQSYELHANKEGYQSKPIDSNRRPVYLNNDLQCKGSCETHACFPQVGVENKVSCWPIGVLSPQLPHVAAKSGIRGELVAQLCREEEDGISEY